MVTTSRLNYLILVDEGDERYEILDGELIPAGSPNTDHQTVSLRMVVRMSAFVDEHDLGRVLHAPYDVLFSDTNVVQPNLLFVSNERAEIITPTSES